MKYQAIKILFCAAVIAALGGCGFGKKTTGNTDTGNDTSDPSKGKVTVAVEAFSKLDLSTFTNSDDAPMLAVSGDGWLYVPIDGGRGLIAFDASSGLGGIDNKAKWHSISLGDTGLDGTAGQAKMAAATQVNDLVPTKNGVLVGRSAPGKANNSGNGAAYLGGKTWKAAWSWADTNRHMLALRFSDKWMTAGVVEKGGQEYPILFEMLPASMGTRAEGISSNSAGGMARVILDMKVGVGGGYLSFEGRPAIAMHGKDAVFVDGDGVQVMVESEIAASGTPSDWSIAARVGPTDKDKGSDAWKQNASVPNDRVNAVLIVGNKLYIGLGSDGTTDGTGGVAIHTIGGSTIAPKGTEWNKIGVITLLKDSDSKVWAVTKNSLIEVKDTGVKGDMLNDNFVQRDLAVTTGAKPKGGYSGTMPTDITGAAFIGKDLILTSKTGVYTKITKQVIVK